MRPGPSAVVLLVVLVAASFSVPAGSLHALGAVEPDFFFFPSAPTSGDVVTFFDATDPRDVVQEWRWDFGDGSPPLSVKAPGQPMPWVETVYARAFGAPAPFVALCYVDADGNGALDPTDPIHAAQSACAGGVVTAGDFRLTTPGGVQVRAGDADAGAAYTPLPSLSVSFFDADGTGAWSLGDSLYAHFGGTSVAAGDLRLTPFGPYLAGTRVESGDVDVNLFTQSAPAAFHVGAWDFEDRDGDLVWSAADRAFVDADGDGFASTADVRLSALGRPVGPDDPDTVTSLAAAHHGAAPPFSEICYYDADGDGVPDDGDGFYAVSGACSTVGSRDLRLTFSSGPAGTLVFPGEPDMFLAVQPLPDAMVDYYDADGDGWLSPGDSLYVDVHGDGVVSTGDVRLTAFGSQGVGTVVTPGAADLNLPLCASSGCVIPAGASVAMWDYQDYNGNGIFDQQDRVVLDVDGQGLVTADDVRLSGGRFGEPVDGLAMDATRVLGAATPPGFAALCYADVDGDGEYSFWDAVYASRSGCGSVAVADLRLAGPAPLEDRATVLPSDPHAGAPTAPLPAGTALAFYDADGDARWTIGDALYLDVLGDGVVGSHDVRLSRGHTFEVGTIVPPGGPDVGHALMPVSAAFDLAGWTFYDSDASSDWSHGDIPYVDADGNGFATPLDVPLLPAPAFVGGGGGIGPAHEYAAPGTYFVTLEVITWGGSSHTVTHAVHVAAPPEGPRADFLVPSMAPLTLAPVAFTDQSSAGSSPIVSWSWDFGDGATSEDVAPVHAYADDGVYLVTLTVVDENGLTDDVTRTIEVRNRAPVAAFVPVDPSPLTLEPVALTDLSQDADGTIVAWSWTFGDGATSTMSAPQHTYADDGTYTVTLTVTDDDGAQATAFGTIEVRNRAPVAAFTWGPTNATTVDVVSFVDQADDPDGFVVERAWTIDGAAVAGPGAPEHRFLTGGAHSVCLTVTDDDGAQATECQTIDVIPVIMKGGAFVADHTTSFAGIELSVSAADTGLLVTQGAERVEASTAAGLPGTAQHARSAVETEVGSVAASVVAETWRLGVPLQGISIELVGLDLQLTQDCAGWASTMHLGALRVNGIVVFSGDGVAIPPGLRVTTPLGTLTLHDVVAGEHGVRVSAVVLTTASGAEEALGVAYADLDACPVR